MHVVARQGISDLVEGYNFDLLVWEKEKHSLAGDNTDREEDLHSAEKRHFWMSPEILIDYLLYLVRIILLRIENVFDLPDWEIFVNFK